MKNGLFTSLAALILLSAPVTLVAQEYEYHPTISDNFTAALGYMRSSNSFKVRADTLADVLPEDPLIDFGDSLGVSNTSSFFNGQLRWKFGSERKWSLWGQYFSNNASGSTTLEDSIEWEGIVFNEGTFVRAGTKLAVTRVFIGRSFYMNDQNDFGFGVGLHNLDLSAYIEGEVIINGESSGVKRLPVSGSQVLPNIGGWYNFSPAKNWLLHARLDWISASIGDYSGSLWNSSIGVNYQAWRHVGFDLSWQYFNLDIKVDKSGWIGGAEMIYSGPVLSVTFGW